MLRYVHQLLTNCVCLLFGTEQILLYILNAYLQHVALITPFYKCIFVRVSCVIILDSGTGTLKSLTETNKETCESALERSTLT